MHRTLPLLLLAGSLAACSGRSTGGGAANTQAPSRDAAMPATAAASVDSHATPKPAPLRTFGDWEIGCDNGGECTMASLGPDGGDFPAVTMAVTRKAGPGGGFDIVLAAQDEAATPSTLAIDGNAIGGRFSKPADGRSTRDGADAASIAAAMANGHDLTVRNLAGQVIATVSLKGASAALRYMDAAQHRVGGMSAIVARGPAPASAVPAAPALPVIVARSASGAAPALDATLIAKLKRSAGCDDQGFIADAKAEGHSIGGGKTLVLVPCDAGAYNVIQRVYVLADGRAVPARVDAPSGFTATDDPSPVPEVVNGSFDDATLTSYAKGRGLGDCGVEQQFVWDGTMLRLSEQAEMPECRGNPNMITTWRSQVVRR